MSKKFRILLGQHTSKGSLQFLALIGKCKCIVFVYVNGTQDCMYDTINTTAVVVLFFVF